MLRQLFIGMIIFLAMGSLQAQTDVLKVSAYWGAITNIKVDSETIKQLDAIKVQDTSQNRNIKWISRYKFYIQPAMEGPVKTVIASGAFFNDQIKSYLSNPQTGDKIVISEIIGFVENEGVRQIPTAIVMVVK